MKVTCYMAISVDGFITKNESDNDWISKTDWNQFYSYINANDAIIMGRKTMEQFGDEFPVESKLNIVLTNDTKLHKDDANVIITAGTPKEILDLATDRTASNILLVGGADLNLQFLKAGLIDELVVSIQPILIGKGISLFGNDELNNKLELISSRSINKEIVLIKYKVIKE